MACCAAALAVCAIGQGLAAARALNPKHATKQVDRLLSNPKINVDDILVRWVPYVVGARTAIVVALDWTDFDADKQATIMVSLITDHGRATPLVWLTVNKNTLKNNRSLYEHRVLVRLAELLPPDVKVCVVADRGFGDQKLYRVLTEELYFDYVIRFRGNIAVTAATGGKPRTAATWVRPGGRARVLRGAAVTADRHAVGTVVCVQAPDMKQAWCSGRQQHRRYSQSSSDWILRPPLANRVRAARIPRTCASAWGWARMHVESPAAARSAMADQRFRGGAADVARRAAGEALGYDRMLGDQIPPSAASTRCSVRASCFTI